MLTQNGHNKSSKKQMTKSIGKVGFGSQFLGWRQLCTNSLLIIHNFILLKFCQLNIWTNIILWCNRNLSFKTKLWMMKSPYKVTARRAFHQNRSRLCTSKELKTWTKTISIILLKNNIISGISSNEMKPKVLSDWNLMDLTQAFWLLGLVHVTSIKLLRESYQIDLAKKYKVIKLFTN